VGLVEAGFGGVRQVPQRRPGESHVRADRAERFSRPVPQLPAEQRAGTPKWKSRMRAYEAPHGVLAHTSTTAAATSRISPPAVSVRSVRATTVPALTRARLQQVDQGYLRAETISSRPGAGRGRRIPPRARGL
jgi:hypothetical protein